MTPMMAQYKELKSQHPDAVLMFRMGDFYEMFFEDAVLAANILDITLTRRGKNEGEDIPMAGVPHHAVQSYIGKLINEGVKVAIGDQVEDPKEAKGIVRREITRVITPGTVLEDSWLNTKANNYLMAAVKVKNGVGVAYADISTGEFVALEKQSSAEDALIEVALKVRPAEILLDPTLFIQSDLQKKLQNHLGQVLLSPRKKENFDLRLATEHLQQQFQVKSLKVFELDQAPLATSAAGALILYVQETQKSGAEQLRSIRLEKEQSGMILDANALKNLELFHSSNGQKQATLIHVLDKTETAMGARLLRRWLLQPLLDKSEIEARLDAVEIVLSKVNLHKSLSEILRGVGDLERLVARLHSGLGSARDLVTMRESLKQLPILLEILPEVEQGRLSAVASQLKNRSGQIAGLVEYLDAHLTDNPPLALSDGGVIKAGVSADLDEYRELASGGKQFLADLEQQERQRTGIEKLKVKFNKVFGYYLEVSKAQLDKVPEDYIRKQTLVNAERFITGELKGYEEKVLSAEEQAKRLEFKLFQEVLVEAKKYSEVVQLVAGSIAEVDVFLSLALVALQNNYNRPEIMESGILNLESVRHPVLEKLTSNFVPHHVELNDNDQQMMIITGPNMAGKSTFMRSVALNVLLAHIGSFIPVSKASVPLTDRIFTRVGASDNLAAGESTFMVEMAETAQILNLATERSLIILDEIGRGTSTYDGVSIAWSVATYIHNQIKAKTLFATHYHELIELEELFDRVKNFHVTVDKSGDTIKFLYQIKPGGVQQSYGIEVAKLAGVPFEVISEAGKKLRELGGQSIQSNKSGKSGKSDKSIKSAWKESGGESGDQRQGRLV